MGTMIASGSATAASGANTRSPVPT